MVRILEARFVTSAPTLQEAPPEEIGEVVFLGRSNVGKSSLLNALCERKQLAKRSATPGKTRLINYFETIFQDEQTNRYRLYFVDLPGFGYAKVSKSIKLEWQKSLNAFIRQRRTIRLFVHLVDARHPDMPIDQGVEAAIMEQIAPDQCYLKVMSKSDKLTQKERGALIRRFPDALLISNTKKSGIDRLRQKIFEIAIKGVSCRL